MLNSTQSLLLIRNDIAKSLSPIVAVLGILILTGGFGNIMVIIYYGIKERTNPSFMFIVAMAICDIMVCFISMPLEIVDVLEFYTFPNAIGCKILRFVNYFASCSSNNFLLAVAVDRYKKLCKPFGHQLSIRTTKIIIAAIFGICLAATLPNFVFYDIVDTNISQFEDVILSSSVIGHDCKTRDEFRLFVMIYHGVLALLFLFIAVSLVIIYINVVKEIIKLKKFRKHIATPNKVSTKIKIKSECGKKAFELKTKNTCAINISSTEFEINQSEPPKVTGHTPEDIYLDAKNCKYNPRSRDFVEENGIQKTTTALSVNSLDKASDHFQAPIIAMNTSAIYVKKNNSPSKTSIHENEIHKRKFTIIAISVTVVFIVSFLPFLVLMVWQTMSDMYMHLIGSQLLAYQFFISSWLLASVLNPFIYSCFNRYFRSFIKSLFISMRMR
ncbi:hypothetical protein KUTeg_000728 [Tegillarca granosa]|uniref:G-protein coupled receptors family 1 profile domain-containing protein n=1 Tax=Tegillarca granosa TaxID=220873 RepID=A0ABQ9G1S3_TEGGR|nr:hypothetical protein KUTeg_000728 [Tegillarca granosa]